MFGCRLLKEGNVSFEASFLRNKRNGASVRSPSADRRWFPLKSAYSYYIEKGGGGQMGDDSYVKRGEFARLDERVNTLDIRQTRTEVRTDNIEHKMDSIESNTSWILRLIIGAIVTALLGLVIL